ncbi:MAG: SMP-30/gluconolactonase/LRE family protein, partial [Gammaproteobacteria bacterium]|nr:SMP-30/gluconolactonase/LRE family protein [Gammaproteobacteria bacterium]
HAFMKDFLEASFTGRLLSYSPGTGTTTVRMDGLFFANGVALGPDERFVLVSETGTGRIHRLWLKSDKAGQRDVFHDGLPGNPDNLSFNGTDTFWIAMPGVRDPAIERSADSLFIRKLLGGLPDSALALPSSTALVAGLGVDGAVVHVLYADPAPVSGITSINQFGDRLVMGSLTARHVMSVPVPPPANQERFP